MIFNNKNGQTWFIDMMIGMVIFIFVLLVFYKTDINLDDQSSEILKDLKFEGDMATNILMSSGYPEDWNWTKINQVGIVKDYKIIPTKIRNLSMLNYDFIKSNLGIKYDFYFYFISQKGILPLFDNTTHQKEGFGYLNVNSTNINEIINPAHLIVINRYAVYNMEIGRLVFLLWSE